jgi:hypothetical protein
MVGQLRVRVEQDGDVVLHPGDAGVVGGAEPGVAGELDQLGAGGPRAGRPVVVRAGVDDDQLGLRCVALQRRQQRGQLRAGVVQHGDDRERGHRAIASIAASRRAADASTGKRSAAARAVSGGGGTSSSASTARAPASASPGA